MSDTAAGSTLISLLGADFRAATGGARPSLLGCVARFILDPGFAVVVRYRFSVATRRFGWVGKVLSKLIWRRNVRVSGCYLSPSSCIGPGLFLPHATAIVVGDGVVAGSDLHLYQSVTLGQRGALYPCLGSGVVVYSGACVLGPVHLGDGVVVGANAVVLRDVVAHTAVGGVPARELAASRDETP